MGRAKKKVEKAETRRGSPEAIAKRRAARQLNTLFGNTAKVAAGFDGRTEKRRRRLLKELKEGRQGQPIRAHEVLTYATELFGMGENLTSIRKLKPLLPPRLPMTDATLATIRETQTAYGFDPRAWSLLGIDVVEIFGGELPPPPPPAPKRRRKSAG